MSLVQIISISELHGTWTMRVARIANDHVMRSRRLKRYVIVVMRIGLQKLVVIGTGIWLIVGRIKTVSDAGLVLGRSTVNWDRRSNGVCLTALTQLTNGRED